MPRTARLTREDWAEAALAMLAEGGPAAVAVEPVAARLGASKSSFYWLFADRRALLEAALERWERRQTDAVLPGLAAIADPAERLRVLVRQAYAAVEGADLALRLLTESGDPVVRPVAERVTRRRLAIIEAAFAELGRPADRARYDASAMYAAYLGTAALRRVDAAPGEGEDFIAALLSAFGVEPRARP
ncbi:TetR/AcrR family transcriptional regulator [Actinomadura sp. 9N215]|uniref:TetR/AcrR family transcriptional regulator n=1 Tax=Actinomadura sp. 9N215 TaxID=3375150 RepID=UPI00378B2296